MALKDLLNDALQATPPENAARQATLRAVLAASGSGSDAEIQSTLTRQISEREQKAASFSAVGQSDLAKAERVEIDALRGLLRKATPEPAGSPAAAPKKPKRAAEPVVEEEAVKPLLTRQQLAIGGAVILAALAVLFFVFRSGGSNDANQVASNAKWTITGDDRSMGNPKAPIVMIEYAAPTCPHCAHFSSTVMPRIKEEYVDTGKVFYVFRVFPINPADGAVEALARTCLPADKYFQFLDLMFRNQSKWDPDGYQITDVGGAIRQMARLMGVAPERADQCMTNQTELDRVNRTAADAQTRYSINQTPTFIINGTIVTTSEATWPQMKARFDSLIAKK